MKECITMADWIDDIFDKVEDADRPTDRQINRLLFLLELCRQYDDKVRDTYEAEILHSDLDMVRYNELTTTFEMDKLNVTWDYAPRQKDLSKWIRMICDLE